MAVNCGVASFVADCILLLAGILWNVGSISGLFQFLGECSSAAMVVIEAIYRYNVGTTQVRLPDALCCHVLGFGILPGKILLLMIRFYIIHKGILCFVLILNYMGDFGYILNIDLRRILACTIVCCIE